MKSSPALDLDAPSRYILDALRHIVRALRLGAHEAEARVGLSAAQLFVLQRLVDNDGLSLRELATRTATDPSSVSVVVSRLVERGLVTRVRAPDDARRVEVAITSQGRKLLARAPGAAQDRLLDALARTSPRARKQLAESLTRLVGEMGLGRAPAPMLFENEPPGGGRRPGVRNVQARRTR